MSYDANMNYLSRTIRNPWARQAYANIMSDDDQEEKTFDSNQVSSTHLY